MNDRNRRGLGALIVFSAAWLAVASHSAVAYAQHGALLLTNEISDNVMVYPRKANGAVVPTRIVTDPSLHAPHGITINPKTKELIVINNHGFSISFFDGDLSSPSFGALKRTIAGPSTGLRFPLGAAVDNAHQELFVSNDDHLNEPVPHMPIYSVTVYDLATLGNGGDIAPIRTIVGDATKLGSPSGIAVDPAWDQIYVVNYDYHNLVGGPSIATFRRTANGNEAPLRSISGPAANLDRPQGIAFDGFDKIYVANSAFDRGPTFSGYVSVFHTTDVGNVAPISLIGGDQTKLCHPIHMSIDILTGELAVAQAGGCAVGATVYSLFNWPVGGVGNLAPIRSVVTGGGAEFEPIGVAIIPDDQQQHLLSNIGPVEANLPGGAAIAFDPGFATCNWAPGSVFPVGTTMVQCSGSDIFGPVTLPAFGVMVVDTTPPVFGGIANIEVEAFTSTEVDWDATATDRGLSVPVTCSPASGSIFVVGTTMVTCVATPSVGPGATASFAVTVTRKVAPLPGGACFVVDFREVTYFNGAAVITSSDPDVRVRNGIAGAFNPALWPYRAAGGNGYTKSRGTLFRIYGFTASSFGALIPNEDQPWITYPVMYDADAAGYYIDLAGPARVRVCPNQLQDYVLAGKKGNGHKDSSALLPTAQQNVPGIMLARNSQIVKLPTRIKREMDGLGLAHGDFGKIEYIAVQQQGNGNAQFREFVNLQLSFPGDSATDRLQHYAFGLLTAFNVNFESFAGCNYLDSAPGNDGVRLRDLWSPNKSTKQGYNVWQACGTREPVANQKVRENYDVAYNGVQVLSTVNSGTDTLNILYGTISPLTDGDKKRKDLKADWFDWDKADR